MALLVFDTHDFITELTEAGIDAAHAKAISEGLKKVRMEHMATKGDIADLREAISALRVEMLGIKSSLLQWFTGMLIGQAALTATLVKLL